HVKRRSISEEAGFHTKLPRLHAFVIIIDAGGTGIRRLLIEAAALEALTPARKHIDVIVYFVAKGHFRRERIHRAMQIKEFKCTDAKAAKDRLIHGIIEEIADVRHFFLMSKAHSILKSKALNRAPLKMSKRRIGIGLIRVIRQKMIQRQIAVRFRSAGC